MHFWFIKNRSKFLPVWRYFDSRRTAAAHEDEFDSTVSLKWRVFRANYKDPFSYFYEPYHITELLKLLKCHRKQEVDEVLIKLVELTDEFVDWESVR